MNLKDRLSPSGLFLCQSMSYCRPTMMHLFIDISKRIKTWYPGARKIWSGLDGTATLFPLFSTIFLVLPLTEVK